jgi:chemotaxis protein CheX
MDELIPFSLEELEEMVVDAVDKYFNTMLEMNVAFVDSQAGLTSVDWDEPPPPVFVTDKALIVSMIGFIGSVCGVINLYLEEDFASYLSCRFLGMTPEEVAEEGPDVINDCLGEMSNMIVGTLKNSICDQGHQCRMTVPSIVRGSNFSIETPDTVFRRIYSFKTMEGAKFVADLTMKMDDGD